MSTGAWVMLFAGLAVLFGGLLICISIALNARPGGTSGEGDA